MNDINEYKKKYEKIIDEYKNIYTYYNKEINNLKKKFDDEKEKILPKEPASFEDLNEMFINIFNADRLKKYIFKYKFKFIRTIILNDKDEESFSEELKSIKLKKSKIDVEIEGENKKILKYKEIFDEIKENSEKLNELKFEDLIIYVKRDIPVIED